MRFFLVFVTGLLLSACVSETLSQQDTVSQPLASAETQSYDPEQRAQAVAEIRAKAAQPGSGELTNAYVTNDGPTKPMNANEQQATIAELEQSAGSNSASVSDAELAAKQKSIQDLRRQANTHYNNAINSIQN